MRYRALSPEDDYVFGQGSTEFLVNSPAAVAQAVKTRLELVEGEWFLDLNEGTPYGSEILGEGTLAVYDQAIKDRILGTDGVVSIDKYASVLDDKRALTVSCTITTIYGETPFRTVL